MTDRAALREKVIDAYRRADDECRQIEGEWEAGPPCESCVAHAILALVEPLVGALEDSTGLLESMTGTSLNEEGAVDEQLRENRSALAQERP